MNARSLSEGFSQEAIEAALEETGAWVVAAYGPRLVTLSIFLDGYMGSQETFWGLGFHLERGVNAAGEAENRTTLRGSQVRLVAEHVLRRLLPGISLTHEPRDVREAAIVRIGSVSAHRRIVLLERHGRFDDVLATAAEAAEAAA